MSVHHDAANDLLALARERLREIEETGNDELGERVELEPGESFVGRYRGPATMVTRESETFEVIGLWDQEGRVKFVYRSFMLGTELEEAQPAVGDEIAIVRGEDREFESRGELRTMHRFSVATRPCSDTLPRQATEQDDGIPF